MNIVDESAVANMDVIECLHLLLIADDLKSDTAKTREISMVLKQMINLEDGKAKDLEKAIDDIRRCITAMFDAVQ
jgi:hypothetical protein